MTLPDSLSAEPFDQYVQACLQHLYDYAFLQNHPLVQWLIPHETGAKQVHAFRERIIQTIEQMRLSDDLPLQSRAGRAYNLLVLRYVEQQETQTVLEQLSLSERQYYREHPKAIRAISALLRGQNLPPAEAPAEPEAPPLSVQDEIQRVQHQGQPDQRVGMDDLLRGVQSATQSLADQHQVSIDYHLPETFAVSAVSSTFLRSILLWLVSDLITRAHTGDTLTVACRVEGRAYQVQIVLVSPAGIQPDLINILQQRDTLRHLARTLDGELVYATPDCNTLTVTLTVLVKEQTVLVIDDNPDVGDLFRRYLTDQPYHILIAPTGEQGIELARTAHPDAIILDIMMPGQDGLAVLQNLKHNPATHEIPVLVCSILETPDLVFSLGADGFLKKPSGQAEFLRALAQLRA